MRSRHSPSTFSDSSPSAASESAGYLGGGALKLGVASAGAGTLENRFTSTPGTAARRLFSFAPQRYTRGRQRPRYTRWNQCESSSDGLLSAIEGRYEKSRAVLRRQTPGSSWASAGEIRITHD